MVYRFAIPTTLVPTGANVLSATLSLNVFDYGNEAFATKPASGNIAWYKVLAQWNEAGLSNTNHPNVGTTVIASGPPKQPESGWEVWNITSTVREWVNNPATNFGVQGSITNEFQKHGYRSSEYGTASMRPKLTITFDATSTERPDVSRARTCAALQARVMPDGAVRVRTALAQGDRYTLSLFNMHGRQLWNGSGTVDPTSAVTIPASAAQSSGRLIAVLTSAGSTTSVTVGP